MIVGICGSPRKGATEHVLREALKMLEKMGFNTEFFTVRGKKIFYSLNGIHVNAKFSCSNIQLGWGVACWGADIF